MSFSLSAFDPRALIDALIDLLSGMEAGTVVSIRPQGKARARKALDTEAVDLGETLFSLLGIPAEYRQSDNGKAESADLEGIIQAFLFDIADKTNSRRGGTQGWSLARYKATPKVLGKWDVDPADLGDLHIKRAYKTQAFTDTDGKTHKRQTQVPGVFVVYSGTPEDMSCADD